MPSLPESALVTAITNAQQYDEAAFDLLYSQYTHTLYRYLYARCGDAGVAEDLLGDLWIRVVEHLPAFRVPKQNPELAFRSWLYRIARNLALNHQRNKHRHSIPLEEAMVAHASSVEEHIEHEEEHAMLYDALAMLTPDQREVLILRFFEECSNAEVALLTGRKEGAVKALQHRALAALARVFEIPLGRKNR